MRTITKEQFLTALDCTTRAWLMHQPGRRPTPSAAERARMEAGKEIHRLARELYPDGVFPNVRSLAPATQTALLMSSPEVRTLFEATFEADGFVARADALRRGAGCWDVIEIKSRLTVGNDLIDDLAYTAMVLTAAGVKLGRCVLVLLRRDYRLGMPTSALFAEHDVTEHVLVRTALFAAQARSVRETIRSGYEPPARPVLACPKCPFYDRCTGKGANHHILELPRLTQARLEALCSEGVYRIAEIPSDFPLSAQQHIVRDAVCTGEPVIDRVRLADELSRVRWPALYLDFEAIATPVPLYPDVAPYELVPTQFSAHICSAPGRIEGHAEYLADPRRDCRGELAARLCPLLESAGSIIVYSGFEQRTIRGLARISPRLHSIYPDCVEKLFDLERTLRPGCYYHPRFAGRSSIKATLPVLVPTLSYEDLAIRDGDSAMAAFGRLACGDCSGAEAREIRRALREYCGRDTLAMIKLHESLLAALN